jgi:ferritin
MISKEMEQMLNDQMNLEFYSSYVYLAMSAYCSSIAYNGCASWMRAQAQEELEHAMKIYDYIVDQGADLRLAKIGEPAREYESLANVFSVALKHEKHVSASINKLMGAAMKSDDYATAVFLQWFVTEQVEEEASVGDIVDLFKRADNQGALFMIDRELGGRSAGRAEQE